MSKIELAIENWILSFGPQFDAVFGFFFDNLRKRLFFSVLIIVVFSILQILVGTMWSKLATDPDILAFDSKKRGHWRLYARLMGFLFFVWPVETQVCTFGDFLRIYGREEWILIFFICMAPLVFAALRRSLQYLKYRIGLAFALNIWIEYIQWMGYGIFVAFLWETAIRFAVDNFPYGLANLLLYASMLLQIFLIVKSLLQMANMFLSSFFTDKYLRDLETKDRIKRHKERYGNSGGGAKGADEFNMEQSGGVDFPSVLYDPYENRYTLRSTSTDHADYYCAATGDSVQFWASDIEDGLPSGWRTGS